MCTLESVNGWGVGDWFWFVTANATCEVKELRIKIKAQNQKMRRLDTRLSNALVKLAPVEQHDALALQREGNQGKACNQRRFSNAGMIACAIRRNCSNISLSDFGRVANDDVSRWTVARCEVC